MSSGNEERRRLFFALWPGDEVREQLHRLTDNVSNQVRGRQMQAENLHLTLAFLGSVDEASYECLRQMASTIHLPSFQLSMDQLGYFRRPQVVWVGSSEIPEPLQLLVNAIKRGQLECGLEPEKRPFQVHLTLMRKVARGIEFNDLSPLIWQVNDFCLVESHILPEGVEYEVLHRWSLQ